jgi:uncharacterized membrane protein YedE/YeeE
MLRNASGRTVRYVTLVITSVTYRSCINGALIGGFLMLFGSRLGGGCTSGHGISGMPLLNMLSVVAVCSMFGSGIFCAIVMDACDVLEISPLQGQI